MRNTRIIAFSIFMLMVFTSCNSFFDDGNNSLRIIAWNYIDGENNSTVIGEWYDGEVTKDVIFQPTSTSAISISWATTQDTLLGPIIVYLDNETQEVLGVGIRL